MLGTAAGFASPLLACSPTTPAGPLARLSGAIEAELAELPARPVVTLDRIQAHLRAAAAAGVFDAWRARASADSDKVGLLSGGPLGRTWKVQLFLIPAGRSHPPHCHENLASCMVVVDGRLQVREYERLRDRETQTAATLRRVFDGELAPGDAILTAEDHRNAHWFGAVDGPALAVNFKASGHFRRELVRLRNRRYLDASHGGQAPFEAPFMESAEAKARFATRPL